MSANRSVIHEFNGFAREITSVVRPDLLQNKTATKSVCRAPDGLSNQPSEEVDVPLNPDSAGAPAIQSIPVIGFDEPSSRRTFAEYSALMRAARDAPSLYESVGFRRMIDHRRKAFLATFGVLP